MKKSDIIAQLSKGVAAWNDWRENNPAVVVNLAGLDLSDKDFSGYNFFEVDLTGARLKRCNLERANFIAAQLEGADLREANLTRANLIASNLKGADLSYANISQAKLMTSLLNNANLAGVDLCGHDLSGQDLRGVNFSHASLVGQVLKGQDLSCADLSGADLSQADLSGANLTQADFSLANCTGCKFQQAICRRSNFSGVNLQGKNLSGINFSGAILRETDLREADLSQAILDNAELTGAKLGKVKTRGWSIRHIKCEYAFWDKSARELTRYHKHEFESLFAESINIELIYDHRLGRIELATLPFILEHMEASHWGCALRLKGIEDVAGGTRVLIGVDETGGHNPAFLEAELKEEASLLQLAQLTARRDPLLQKDLKEAFAGIKEKFWPKLLELAHEHETDQMRKLTVLFMDLKDFSRWAEGEVTEKLSLFRGLVKPILSRWRANYPNMEGDSLRATFRNASAGIACACMIQRVLSAAGFEVRLGMDLGHVMVVHNEVTEQPDLEGQAVNFAARLEAHAQTGQILVSETVRHYADQQKGYFNFSPVSVKLDKGVGNRRPGDEVDCYAVDLIKVPS